MAKKKFKMRQAPKAPVRYTNITETLYYLSEQSLADVIAWAAKWNVDPKNVSFDNDSVYNSESGYPMALLQRTETDEEFEQRMTVYKKHLAEYQQWETEYAEEIKATRAADKKKNDADKKKNEARKQQEDEELLVHYETSAAKLRKKLGK